MLSKPTELNQKLSKRNRMYNQQRIEPKVSDFVKSLLDEIVVISDDEHTVNKLNTTLEGEDGHKE